MLSTISFHNRFLQLILRLSIAFLACTSWLLAQEGMLPLGNSSDKLHYKVWHSSNGLPHWNNQLLLVDHRDMLWIRSGDIIVKFDGSTFHTVDTLDIHVGDPMVMVEDYSGRLWLTDTKHLWRYDTTSLPSNSPGSIARKRISLPNTPEKVDHEYYLLTVNDVVHILGYTKACARIWQLNDSDEFELSFEGPIQVEDGTHRILGYLPSSEDGLFWRIQLHQGPQLIDTEGHIIADFSHLLNTLYEHIYFQGQYYSSNLQDVALAGIKSFQPLRQGVPALPNLELSRWRKSTKYPFDTQFFFSKNGLVYIPPLHDHLYTVVPGQPLGRLPHIVSNFNFISKDHSHLELVNNSKFSTRQFFHYKLAQQNLFIHYEQGIVQLSVHKSFIDRISGYRSIRSIDFISDQKLIYTTNRGRLWLYNLATNTVEKILSSGIYSIKVDQDLVIAGLYGGGMKLYDHNFNLLTSFDPFKTASLLAKHCRSPLRVQDSLIYYGTDNGLAKVNIITGDSQVSYKGTDCLWLHEDKNGSLWMGSESGLYHLDNQEVFLDTLDGKPLRIEHIYEDESGIFWLSTDAGLVKWQPFSDNYEQYGKPQGFACQEIHAAYPDQLGRLWLSSNDGIILFDARTHDVVNYDSKTSSILSDEHNFLAHTMGQDGKIYFGCLRGVNRIDPNLVDANETFEMPILHLAEGYEVSSDGDIKQIHMTRNPGAFQGVSTSPDCVQLRMKFDFPNYDQVSYTYEWRIKSITPKWTVVSDPRQLDVNGLPHGSNDLQIRVSSVHRPQVTQTFSFFIYRQFYWHQLLIFRISGAMLLLFAVAYFVHRRGKALKLANRQLVELVKERTAELETQNIRIHEQNLALLQVDETKNQLFKNISHEFRTPLGIIQLYTERLLQEQRVINYPEIHNILTKINSQQGTMKVMVDEFLELSSFELGKVKNEPKTTLWNTFFMRIAGQFESLAQRKRQDYSISSDFNEETWLYVDLAKVERIINNLIQNAIKFTPDSGRILIKTSQIGDMVEVLVADTGPGIPKEEQQAIFQRYYQSSHSLSTSNPGFGIGLALCQEYAKIIGAKLWVESIPEQGATFFLHFPLQVATVNTVAADETCLSSEREAIPRTFKQLNKPPASTHILVVEDHPEMRDFLLHLLAEEYRVSVAENGMQAWNLLENSSSPVDLVISDVMMPLLDGYNLLHKVRSDSQLALVPFLIMTALSSDQDKLKAIRLGSDGILHKPFSISELQTVVKNLLTNHRKRLSFYAERRELSKGKAAFHTTPEEGQILEITSYDTLWMEELDKLIQEKMHLGTFNVNALAFELNITDRTLRNKIRAYTGLTPSAYLLQARLNKAKLFLVAKKYATIAEVAYAVGFNDPKLFSRRFKKAMGKLPSELL